jgi:hypothetical protein
MEFRLLRGTENSRNSVPNHSEEDENAWNSIPWKRNKKTIENMFQSILQKRKQIKPKQTKDQPKQIKDKLGKKTNLFLSPLETSPYIVRTTIQRPSVAHFSLEMSPAAVIPLDLSILQHGACATPCSSCPNKSVCPKQPARLLNVSVLLQTVLPPGRVPFTALQQLVLP